METVIACVTWEFCCPTCGCEETLEGEINSEERVKCEFCGEEYEVVG